MNDYQLPLIPYVDGDPFKGTVVVATNGGYARYSNLSAAKSFWSDAPTVGDRGNALFPAPTAALVSVNTQDIRVRTGTAPTASEGVVWKATGVPAIFFNELDFLKALKAIETTATAEVTIQWFYQW